MHSSYVESKGCHFLFYGVIRKKVNCCFCSGLFPVYVYFKSGVSVSVEKGYGIVFFACGVKLLCILFIYVMMVCKMVFVLSYMTNLSPTNRTQSAMLFISGRCFIFASL